MCKVSLTVNITDVYLLTFTAVFILFYFIFYTFPCVCIVQDVRVEEDEFTAVSARTDPHTHTDSKHTGGPNQADHCRSVQLRHTRTHTHSHPNRHQSFHSVIHIRGWAIWLKIYIAV